MEVLLPVRIRISLNPLMFRRSEQRSLRLQDAELRSRCALSWTNSLSLNNRSDELPVSARDAVENRLLFYNQVRRHSRVCPMNFAKVEDLSLQKTAQPTQPIDRIGGWHEHRCICAKFDDLSDG